MRCGSLTDIKPVVSFSNGMTSRSNTSPGINSEGRPSRVTVELLGTLRRAPSALARQRLFGVTGARHKRSHLRMDSDRVSLTHAPQPQQ